MAQRITVTLEDDLDGGPADETVRFGIDSADYEIDLSKKHASAFRRKLAPSLSTRARLAEDSAAGPVALRQAGIAAAVSGHGRRARASQSANAGAFPPASSSSTRPPRPDADLSADQGRSEAISPRWSRASAQ